MGREGQVKTNPQGHQVERVCLSTPKKKHEHDERSRSALRAAKRSSKFVIIYDREPFLLSTKLRVNLLTAHTYGELLLLYI